MRILLLRRAPVVERKDDIERLFEQFVPRLHRCLPGLELSEAEHLTAATLGAVEARRFDIVILAQAGAGATADEDYDRILAPLTNLRATAPRVPVLYVALDGNEWLAAAAIKYGAQDYLPLPHLQDHVLVRAIKECLAGRRLPTAGHARRWAAGGDAQEEEAPRPKKRRREGNTTPADVAIVSSAQKAPPPLEPDVTAQGLEHAPDIAGYQILRVVGEGGTATTYLALDERTRRYVVIKYLRYTNNLSNLDSVRVFKREYEVIASLNDRRVVGVLDSGVRDDGAYMVVEYFPGGDLGRRMRLPMTTRDALLYARGIARALKLIHANGICHRDLKPGNVMLREDGSVALIDFGLAKLDEGQTLAQAGRVLGTPSYLSPEQGIGAPIDEASDIYSLGCVLYEMLAGRVPYVADRAIKVIDMHVRGPVPTLPPEVAFLQPLIDRMMAKKREARIRSAEDLIRQIDAALRDLPAQEHG